jgi:sterol desaturase/sphingolipid hydroxylase (fatty acid hydroxylase superfamily)
VTGFLASLAVHIGITYMFLAAFLCLLIAAELALPGPTPISRAARTRAILFNAVYLPFLLLVAALVSLIMARSGIRPLLTGLGAASVIVAAVAGDFLYYWYHRAQHSIPWLWRIHSVHHSAEELGAGSGFHHLLEAPMKSVLVGVPLALFVARSGAPILAFVISIHGYYVHSGTRLNFGRFAWVVCDNRIHRVHHSQDPDHFNRNYGVITLLWDRLFGTARFPTKNEWPIVGLEDKREPRTIAEWLKSASSRPQFSNQPQSSLRPPMKS